jgi:hypothetical protein
MFSFKTLSTMTAFNYHLVRLWDKPSDVLTLESKLCANPLAQSWGPLHTLDSKVVTWGAILLGSIAHPGEGEGTFCPPDCCLFCIMVHMEMTANFMPCPHCGSEVPFLCGSITPCLPNTVLGVMGGFLTRGASHVEFWVGGTFWT